MHKVRVSHLLLLGVLLISATLTACENLFGGNGAGSGTDPAIDGTVVLTLDLQQTLGAKLDIDGSLSATNYRFDSLDVDVEATWDEEPDGEPESLSGAFTFDGVEYQVGAIFEKQQLIGHFFDAMDALFDDESDPAGMDVTEGEVSDLNEWDGSSVTIEFDDHEKFQDGIIEVSTIADADARVSITSIETVQLQGNGQSIDLDATVIFESIPGDDDEPIDLQGVITLDGTVFDLALVIDAVGLFGLIGEVMEGLGDYLDNNGDPNPYDDPEKYPPQLHITVDDDDAIVVTILFDDFDPR